MASPNPNPNLQVVCGGVLGEVVLDEERARHREARRHRAGVLLVAARVVREEAARVALEVSAHGLEHGGPGGGVQQRADRADHLVEAVLHGLVLQLAGDGLGHHPQAGGVERVPRLVLVAAKLPRRVAVVACLLIAGERHDLEHAAGDVLEVLQPA